MKLRGVSLTKVVHKKYTYRNGKRYGPYLYETKRVKGQIVTKYLGSAESKKRSVLVPGLIVGILFVLLLIFIGIQFNFTGNVSLDIKSRYKAGEDITGNLKLNLKPGELIPRDSKIIVNFNGEDKEFVLSQLVDEGYEKGKFYSEGVSLSGEGIGFGVKGVKNIYPEVDFDLLISEDSKVAGEVSEESSGEEPGTSSGDSENNGGQSSQNDSTINETDVITDNQNDSILDGNQNDSVSDNGAIVNEDNHTSGSSDQSENDSEAIVSESSDNGQDSAVIEEPQPADNSQEFEVTQSESDSQSEQDQAASGSLITGGVISEESSIISGRASKDNDFEYSLNEGESASIFKGSVKSGGERIDSDYLKLKIKNGKAIVSTDYYIEEEGFGEEYLNDKKGITLTIDLESFGLVAENSSILGIQLLADDEVLVEIEKDISVDSSPFSQISNQTNSTNETIEGLLVENASSQTVQLERIVLGQPVKWKKVVNVSGPARVSVEIPSEAEVLDIRKIAGNKGDLNEEARIDKNSPEEQQATEEGNSIIDEENQTIVEESSLGEDNESSSDLVREQEGAIPEESNPVSEDNIGIPDENSEIIADISGNVISGRVTAEIDSSSEPFFKRFFSRMLSITGRVVSENVSEVQEVVVDVTSDDESVEVEYVTEAPSSFEEERGQGKRIIISGPEELNYTDILAYTSLDNFLDINSADRIVMYWYDSEVPEDVLNGQTDSDGSGELFIFDGKPVMKRAVNFSYYDNDEDGKIDYIDWIVPHLSNQTYDIIVITKAEHLDENRTLISDIYDSVYSLDGNWSETIYDGDYVRVTFELNLTSERDITVFPRIVSGEPRIEVYEIDGNETVAEFESLESGVFNKVYLTELLGIQDSFDLHVLGGDVEFDYIVDPSLTAVGQYVDNAPPYSIDGIRDIFVSGGYAYGPSYYDDTLTVINITDPTNPTPVAEYIDSAPPYSIDAARDVFVSGNYVYVASYNDDSLTVINITDPTSPTGVGQYVDSAPPYSIDAAIQLYISGDYAYVSSSVDASLTVINISDPTNPVAVGDYVSTSQPYVLTTVTEIVVSGDYAYLTEYSTGSFYIVNISDPTNPTPIGKYNSSTSPYSTAGTSAVGVYGNYAYVGTAGSEITVLNVTDPTNPTPIGSYIQDAPPYSVTNAYDILAYNDYVYVASYNYDSVTVLNVTDPTSPTAVADYVDSVPPYSIDAASGLYLYGDYLYVASFVDDSLTVLNMTGYLPTIPDETAPLVTITYPGNITYNYSDLPITVLVGLDEEGSVDYSLDGGVTNVSLNATGGGSTGTDFPGSIDNLTNGSYTFSVYAEDLAGNKNYAESVNFELQPNWFFNTSILNSSGDALTARIVISGASGEVYNSSSNNHSVMIPQGNYDILVEPEISSVNYVLFENYSFNQSISNIVYFDDGITVSGYDSAFAVNPLLPGFVSANLSFKATGDTLYKCADWDFNSRSCTGSWQDALSGLIIGEDYQLVLTPGDPGYAYVSFNITDEPLFSHISLSDPTIKAYLPFDVNASATTVYDYSGNDYDGTFGGGAQLVSGCVYGNCVLFDGLDDASDDKLDLSGLGDTGIFNNSFTVSLWLRPGEGQTTTLANIFGNNNGIATTRGFVLRPSASSSPYTPRMQTHDGTSGVTIVASNSINALEWSHVAFGYNKETGNLTMYVNGVASPEVIAPSSGFDISTDPSFSVVGIASRPYNGSIDEFMIFNRSLSSSEISDLYANQSQRFYLTGERIFKEINVSVTGLETALNITINQSLSYPGANFSVRAGDSGAGDYVYGDEFGIDISIGSVSSVPIVDPNNVSVKMIYNSDPYGFYTPNYWNDSIIITGLVGTDETSPLTAINLPANTTYYSSDLPLSFNVTLNENGSVSYSLDGGTHNVSMTGDEGGAFGVDFVGSNSSLGTGSYVFSAYANDTAGNTNYTENVSFFFESSEVSSCRNLISPNTLYTLTTNLASTGTCIQVLAENITLNGAGFSITGNNASGNYGINATGIKNFTVQNINVSNFATSVSVSARVLGAVAGNMTLVNSSLERISADGHTPATGSGTNAGIISIQNSNVSFVISAKGGTASSVLGSRGQGGVVIIDNSMLNVSNVRIDVSNGNTGSIASKAGGTLYLNYSIGFEDNNAVYSNQTYLNLINSSASGGEIAWDLYSNLDIVSNLSTHTSLYYNFAEIDSDVLTRLNSSANITLYGTPGKDLLHPELDRNGLRCGSLCYNLTSLTAEVVVFNVSSWTSYSVGDNSPPNDPNTLLLVVGGKNATTDDLYCRDNIITDPEADSMNVSVIWYNQSVEHLRFDYNNSYVNGSTFEAVLTSGNTSVDDVWSCGLRYNDGVSSSNWVNSSVLRITDGVAPSINFTDPTPSNASTISQNNIYVNLTSSDGSSHYSVLDFNDDLKLWYRFDDTNAFGNPVDLSDGSNNGTFGGDAEINSGNGTFGDGLYIDGAGDYVSYGSSIDMNAAEFTAAGWIRLNQLGVDHTIIHGAISGVNDDVLYLKVNTGNDAQMLNDFGVNVFGQTGDDFSLNTWYHVAFTLNNATQMASLYINGVNIHNDTAFTMPSSETWTFRLAIGNGRDDGGDLWSANGSIDEVMLFNRSLSPNEIQSLYDAGASHYYNNFTGLTGESYNFKGYAVDSSGNLNSTERRYVNLNLNIAPNNPAVYINSTDGNNYSSQNLNCFATLSDDDANALNVTVEWYNSTTRMLSLDYNNSYANSTLFKAVLNSQNTSRNDVWSCGVRIFDGTAYSDWINSTSLLVLNTPPGAPTLSSPASGSSTTDRTPRLAWTGVDDLVDGDTITYEVNVSCRNTAGGGCTSKGDDNRYATGVSTAFYDIQGDLQYLIDNNYYYNWSVRAYDGINYSSWAPAFTFNVSSLIVVSLPVNSVEFGQIAYLDSNDTTNNSPLPFIIQNDGNAFVNITFFSTIPWTTQAGLSSSYYQFKVDNSTSEPGSFSWASSQTVFTNVPIESSPLLAISGLNYTNATDSAEIDILISVPPNEGPNLKNATVTFTASLGE